MKCQGVSWAGPGDKACRSVFSGKKATVAASQSAQHLLFNFTGIRRYPIPAVRVFAQPPLILFPAIPLPTRRFLASSIYLEALP